MFTVQVKVDYVVMNLVLKDEELIPFLKTMEKAVWTSFDKEVNKVETLVEYVEEKE